MNMKDTVFGVGALFLFLLFGGLASTIVAGIIDLAFYILWGQPA